MQLFDTHGHLSDEAFKEDQQQVIEQMLEAGVSLTLDVGCDLASSRSAAALSRKYPFIYFSAGIHPHAADEADGSGLEEIALLLGDEKAVALGEIGLDYHYLTHEKTVQMAAFCAQLELAKMAEKPVILHIREAWGDFLPMLKGWSVPGVAHCFSGSVESARACLDAGLYISFSGSVTYKNAVGLKEVAKYVPQDRLLVETDCPYLAPVPMRGKRNVPAYVEHTCRHVALLREMEPEELAEITLNNGCRLFGIPEQS